jgi:hypothetical protein
MGIVLEFPARQETASRGVTMPERCGEVVILPVIRIERYDSEPARYTTPRKGEAGRKRRRRASRS